MRQAASSIPNLAARHALIGAYQVGFTSTFNHLMGIAAVVSLIGAVGALALVRQRDFVPSYSTRRGYRRTDPADPTPSGGNNGVDHDQRPARPLDSPTRRVWRPATRGGTRSSKPTVPPCPRANRATSTRRPGSSC